MSDCPRNPGLASRVAAAPLGPAAVIILYALSTLIGLSVIAAHAVPVILLDLLAAAVVLVPPMLAGLWLPPLLGLRRVPLRWHFIVGATLGIGVFSLLILVLGLAGWLHRPLWIVILAVLTGVGALRMRRLLAEHASTRKALHADRDTGRLRLGWIATVPFLIAGLLAASNPPGVIWSEEGFGYDVLEYHLQMPREYLNHGRISYAPHNVYASFPANVEMLYLVSMILQDNAVDTGTIAHMMHLMLGALSVAIAWCAGSCLSRRIGMFTGVLMGTVGWLPYLSGLAYVEHGLLAFGMLAVAAVLQLRRTPRHDEIDNHPPLASPCNTVRSWCAVGGLAAGLACGCKYTAVPMIAFPVALLAALNGQSVRERLRRVTNVSLCALATFSPWMLKNLVYTGNPLFPLAHRVFQTYPPGWDAESAERWQRGHAADTLDRTAANETGPLHRPSSTTGAALRDRLITAWRHLPADPHQRFGPLLLLLPLACLMSRRGAIAEPAMIRDLILLVIGPFVIWMLATHVYARFAVPLLLPLCLLSGLGADALWSRGFRAATMVVALAGMGWNLWFVARLHQAESVPGLPASALYEGQLAAFESFGLVNRTLPIDARVLLLGDARAFYLQREITYATVFNVHPFVEACARDPNPSAIMAWLSAERYTHVLVNWSEIARLRRTYGFSELITPALFSSLTVSGLQREWPADERDRAIPDVQLYSMPRDR